MNKTMYKVEDGAKIYRSYNVLSYNGRKRDMVGMNMKTKLIHGIFVKIGYHRRTSGLRMKMTRKHCVVRIDSNR